MRSRPLYILSPMQGRIMKTVIEPLRAADVDAIYSLLREHHLPVAGLAEHLATTLVAREEGRILGSAALELYDHDALLRSVAVVGDRRGQQIGRELTSTALQLAKKNGVTAVYLLTTTAEQYFPKFGFERIDRADVPSAVQSSIEFTSACPSSAMVMRKIL
jgi:amino-acid N-acetyltransferase